jgi:hypothetical protein
MAVRVCAIHGDAANIAVTNAVGAVSPPPPPRHRSCATVLLRFSRPAPATRAATVATVAAAAAASAAVAVAATPNNAQLGFPRKFNSARTGFGPASAGAGALLSLIHCPLRLYSQVFS